MGQLDIFHGEAGEEGLIFISSHRLDADMGYIGTIIINFVDTGHSRILPAL